MIRLNRNPLEFKKFPNNESFLDLDQDLQDENVITFKFESDEEFFHLQMLKDAIDEAGKKASLVMPYLPYSRMDRKEEKRLFSLKTIAKMLNRMNFTSVEIWEPHSDVSIALIDRIKVKNKSVQLAEDLLRKLGNEEEDICIVYPDQGASKRYGKKINHDYPITCDKVRDFNTGRITSIRLMADGIGSCKKAVIVDDLCSKGGTFIMTAKALKERFPMLEEIYLVVTHCENTAFDGELFTGGLITGIITTNSILDIVRFRNLKSEIVYHSYVEII